MLNVFKRVAAASILSVFLAAVAWGETHPKIQAGINAFQQGHFDEAKTLFGEALSSPSWVFAALYNMGNTAVRQNHLGEALGFYTRALFVNPHDRDTRENIQYVIGNLGAKRQTASASNYLVFKTQVLDRFTFNEGLLVLLIFSFFALSNLLSQIRIWKSENEESVLKTGFVIWSACFVIVLSICSLKLIDSYTSRGIVIVDHAEVRSGPGPANASMVEMGEGTEVSILDTDHDWVQVSSPATGLVGWMQGTSVMVTSGGGPF